MTAVVLRPEGQTSTITFIQKGDREHTTALHPALKPLFQQLQAQGRTFTWRTPEGLHPVWASSRWQKFLTVLGLKAKGVCFHSTRVTVVTELARSDIKESQAMSYVGHASTTVHRIYQRLQPSDLAACVSAVAGPHLITGDPDSSAATPHHG
jgi:integrase